MPVDFEDVTPGTEDNSRGSEVNRRLAALRDALNDVLAAVGGDAVDEAAAAAAALGIAGVTELVVATRPDQRGLVVHGANDTNLKHLFFTDDFNGAPISWLMNAGGWFTNDRVQTVRDLSAAPQNAWDIYGTRLQNGTIEYAAAGPPGNKLPYADAMQEAYEGSRAGTAGSWTVDGGSAPAVINGGSIAAVAATNILRLTAPGTSMTAATAAGSAGIPVTAGNTYSAILHAKAVAAARSPKAGLRWYDASAAVLSTGLGPAVATGTSAWTTITSGALTAPTGATHAAVVANWPRTVASEQHLLSGAGIWDGTVTAFGPPAVSQPWPTFGQTAAGDRWWRSDTPSTANQRLYICTTGGLPHQQVWVGIL